MNKLQIYFDRIKPKPMVPIYPGSPAHESNPGCQFVTYAPEGEALPDIVEKFADDHNEWQKSFFNAWEKMQKNGYDKLTPAPSSGNLLGVKGPEGVPCVDKATSGYCNFRNQRRCKNKWWYPKSQCMATCGYCQAHSNGNHSQCKFISVTSLMCIHHFFSTMHGL